MTCITTNWVIVGNHFVVACRRWALLQTGTLSTILMGCRGDNAYCYPVSNCFMVTCRDEGVPCYELSVFGDQNAEFACYSSGKLCIVAQVGKVQFLCTYMDANLPFIKRDKEASVDTVLSSKEQFRTGKCVPASWEMCNMSGCIFIYVFNNKIEGTF